MRIGTKRVQLEDVTFTVKWSFRDMLELQTWAQGALEGLEGEGKQDGIVETLAMLEKFIVDWEGFVDQDGVNVPYAPDKLELLGPDVPWLILGALGLGGTPGNATDGSERAGTSDSSVA